MDRLESDTARFAETLRQGVPGLDIHTFGSMMQYHYDRGAAAAAGGDSGKQGGEQMLQDGGGGEDGVDRGEGSGAEVSGDGGCHRTALEDALWDEGVFASEQCFLFLSTAIQEGGLSGSGEIGEKGQTGEMGKAAQGSSLVDELARKWIRAGIQARGATAR
jgi:hypothetical protein